MSITRFFNFLNQSWYQYTAKWDWFRFPFCSDVRHLYNTKCDYYIEGTFREKITKEYMNKNRLSFFHMNVKVCQSTLMISNNLILILLTLDFPLLVWLKLGLRNTNMMCTTCVIMTVSTDTGVVRKEVACQFIYMTKFHLLSGKLLSTSTVKWKLNLLKLREIYLTLRVIY